MSPRDIHAIIKEEIARRQKHKQQELSSKAYKLLSEGKTTVEVAKILNLPASKVSKLYRGYWHLKGLHKLNLIYKETNGKLGPFLKLYRLMKEKGMSVEQVVNVVEIASHKLPYMETLYKQVKDQAEKMQRTIQRLENDIEERKNKISLLDQIAFSSDQECKRTEQRVQDLPDKKKRTEKLIANILNGEDHSKIKQIVKENVKAILSVNKILLSAAFAALIQTLKSDPQMVKLIYNISTANDGKQHNNNKNNITKYLGFNMDSL